MVRKDAVRRGYDEVAARYAERRSVDDRGTAILSEFLGSLPDPGRILDAGCGQGRPVLARVGVEATAVGLDVSREQLRLARGNAPGASLVQGDMTHLPFDDGAFDAVVAYWSLIHVPMDDHRDVIDEFARVLGPGGRVLVCEGTDEWSGSNPDWLDAGVEMQWEMAGAAATREQLESAGFAVTDTWGAPERLGDDAARDDETPIEEGDDEAPTDEGEGEDLPWTFFAATRSG